MLDLIPSQPTLVITTSIGLVLGFVANSLIWPKPISGIPHNEVNSVWGDLKELIKAKSEKGAATLYFVEPLADRLGPIFQIVMGPLGNVVVVSDAQEMEDLLLRRSKSLEASQFSMNLIGGAFKLSHAALRTSDQRYKSHRRALAPSMTPRYLKLMTPRIISNIDSLMRLWKDKMQVVQQNDGSCFSCDQDLHLLAMDTLGEICLGQNFYGIDNSHATLYNQVPQIDSNGGTTFPRANGSSLHQAVEYVIKTIESAGAAPPSLLPLYYFFIKLGSSWRSNYGVLSSLIDDKIEQARARVKGVKAQGVIQDVADCILDMAVEWEGKEGLDAMSDTELTDELMGLMVAGQDNISGTLAFGVKFLSNNPDAQRRLRCELSTKQASLLQSRSLTYDEVSSTEELPYLEAVVSEILRLGAVSACINKEATEDMAILGCNIPKGTKMLFLNGYVGTSTTNGMGEKGARASDPVRSPSSINHGLSKGRWSESDVHLFKPERWLVEEHIPGGTRKMKFSAKEGVSFPFGLGPRQCFGMRLVVLQMKLFIASLNLAFFLDKVPEPLNGFEARAATARHPKQAFIRLKEWHDVE